LDKQLYSGKDGVAGELEHVTWLDGKMLHTYRKQAGSFTKVSQFKKFLKTMMSLVILSFNPEIVVLGGGLIVLPGLEKQAQQFAVNVGEYQNRTKVVVSRLKHAGIIGSVLPLLKK
jgi:predicted NBD/HSP70 family sugar kinase